MCPKLYGMVLGESPLWFGEEMVLPNASQGG